MPTPAPVQFTTADGTLIGPMDAAGTQYYFKPLPSLLLYQQRTDQRGVLVFRNGLLVNEYADYEAKSGWVALATKLDSDTVNGLLFSRFAPTKLNLTTDGLTRVGTTSLRLSPLAPVTTTTIPFMLFKNGALLTGNGSGYSYSGPWITATVAIQPTDVFIALISLSGASCSTFDATITGAVNGSNVNFVLPSSANQMMLFRNGSYLTKGVDYQQSGVSLTMASAPANGSILTAQIYSVDGPTQVSSADGTMTFSTASKSILFRNGVMMTQPYDAITSGDDVTLSTTQLPSEPFFDTETYYVSASTGNDAWSGLLPAASPSNTNGPFRTLARAQSAMQAGSIKRTIIQAGTYSIASGFNLTSADNGEEWIGVAGQTPIFEGSGTGNVNLSHLSNVTIKGLKIQNMAAGGLIVDTVSRLTLRWNTFLNSTHNAISGFVLTDSVIDSNVIDGQHPGTISGPGSTPYWAIELGIGCNNNHITHNLIQNCEGGGINFGAGATDPPNNDNVIDRNILKSVNTNSSDSGAIYFYDITHSASGLQITNNIIDGNGDGSFADASNAIYLDAATSHAVVTGNICRNCGMFAWHINWGDHNTIENNIFDLTPSGSLLGIYQDWVDPIRVPGTYGMIANVFQRNIVYFGGVPPVALFQVDILGGDALPVDSGNMYYSAIGSPIPNVLPVIDPSPFLNNPEFANPAGGDYSMPSSSPAFTLMMFNPLPTDQGPIPRPALG